jgi:hypothetical protein
VASNRDELAKLIEELKGHRPIRPLSKDLIDEDSSSNSRPSEKEEKVIEEVKPSEQEYSIDNANASDQFPLKQTIRLIKKPEVEVAEAPEQSADEKEMEIQERAIQKKRRRK